MRSKQDLKRAWKEAEDVVLVHQGFLYVLKAICTELIRLHYNNLLADHFKIEKTRELIAQKYY